MKDLAELERRINAALQRIDAGLELAAARPVAPVAGTADAGETATLRAELAAERALTAALRAELAAQDEAADNIEAANAAPRGDAVENGVGESADAASAVVALPVPESPVPARAATDLEARVEQLTRQVDTQALELHRMRKHVGQLRENLRALRRAASDKLPDPDLINRAMAAELESIRVSRFAEMAELDGIIAELDPLLAPEMTEDA